MDKYTVLIGGVPGVGKSSVSGELARRLNFNILLSGDYLREFYRAYVDPEDMINTSVYEAWKPLGEKNEDNVLKGFLNQAEKMSSGIKAIVERASQNGEYLVLETLYFVPSLIEEVMDGVIPLYLYFENEEFHAKSLNSRTEYTHFKSPGERLSQKLWEYRIMMKHSMKECKELGIPAYDMTDYGISVNSIIKYVKDNMEGNK